MHLCRPYVYCCGEWHDCRHLHGHWDLRESGRLCGAPHGLQHLTQRRAWRGPPCMRGGRQRHRLGEPPADCLPARPGHCETEPNPVGLMKYWIVHDCHALSHWSLSQAQTWRYTNAVNVELSFDRDCLLILRKYAWLGARGTWDLKTHSTIR